MRTLATLLIATLLLAGCVPYYAWDPGFNEAFSRQTSRLPGGNQTLGRVLGLPSLQPDPPLLASHSNVWPGPAKPETALLAPPQTQSTRAVFPEHLLQTQRHSGGYGLCHRTQSGPPPGVALGLCYAAGH